MGGGGGILILHTHQLGIIDVPCRGIAFDLHFWVKIAFRPVAISFEYLCTSRNLCWTSRQCECDNPAGQNGLLWVWIATGKQDVCFRVIKELTQLPGIMLPEASSAEKLCDDYPMFFSEIRLMMEKITIQLAAMYTTITAKVVTDSQIGSVCTNHRKGTGAHYKELSSKNVQSGLLPERHAKENATVTALVPSNYSQQ